MRTAPLIAALLGALLLLLPTSQAASITRPHDHTPTKRMFNDPALNRGKRVLEEGIDGIRHVRQRGAEPGDAMEIDGFPARVAPSYPTGNARGGGWSVPAHRDAGYGPEHLAVGYGTAGVGFDGLVQGRGWPNAQRFEWHESVEAPFRSVRYRTGPFPPSDVTRRSYGSAALRVGDGHGTEDGGAISDLRVHTEELALLRQSISDVQSRGVMAASKRDLAELRDRIARLYRSTGALEEDLERLANSSGQTYSAFERRAVDALCSSLSGAIEQGKATVSKAAETIEAIETWLPTGFAASNADVL